MDEEPPIRPGPDGDDGVRYLPGVSPPADDASASDLTTTDVLTGCVQLVGLVIKLVLLLALLAMIVWFLVVIITTPM
jgi:hypothetical protein